MAQLVANVDLQVSVTELPLDNLEKDRGIFSPRKSWHSVILFKNLENAENSVEP